MRSALDGEREGNERSSEDVAELIGALRKVAALADGDQSGDDDDGVMGIGTEHEDDEDMRKAKFEAAKKAAIEASRAAILGGSSTGQPNVEEEEDEELTDYEE